MFNNSRKDSVVLCSFVFFYVFLLVTVLFVPYRIASFVLKNKVLFLLFRPVFVCSTCKFVRVELFDF